MITIGNADKNTLDALAMENDRAGDPDFRVRRLAALWARAIYQSVVERLGFPSSLRRD